jgi:8-oxo-dGTP pyrophosphatase MutT (NUDIX family)
MSTSDLHDTMSQDVRFVARVLLLDPRGCVFLIEGRDPGEPDRPTFRFTPGGKIDAGESAAEAAARELAEETGIVVAPAALGPVVASEDSQYRFLGQPYRQHGVFFALTVGQAGLADPAAWTPTERRTILSARWWTLGEIETASCDIYPAHLAAILRDLAVA